MAGVKQQDLLLLASLAAREFSDLPAEYTLAGMARPLDHRERMALAYLQASLTLVNRLGGLREGFLPNLSIPLHLPDSDPGDGEFQDWVEVEEPSHKHKP